MTIEEFSLKMNRVINESYKPLHEKTQLREALKDITEQLHEMNPIGTEFGIKPIDDGLNYPPRQYQRV